MDENYCIDVLDMDEIPQVASMILRAFDRFVAPDYGADGVAEFYRHVEPERLRERVEDEGQEILCCKDRHGAIVGMIAMKGGSHIALLFVDPAHMGQGIARALFARWLEDHPVEQITVNSSPYAVPVYERLGFRAVRREETVNGIRAVPMKRVFKRKTQS